MPFVIDKYKSENWASISEEFTLFNWSSVGYIWPTVCSKLGLSMLRKSSKYLEILDLAWFAWFEHEKVSYYQDSEQKDAD